MLGRDAIKDITLKLGDVELPQVKEPAYRPAPVKLDDETMQQIDGYVKDLEDAETREAFRRLIEKDFQLKEENVVKKTFWPQIYADGRRLDIKPETTLDTEETETSDYGGCNSKT